MIYAGIGATETPEEIQKLMGRIAQSLALRGHVLRSGGARGADTAFEQGCDAAAGKKIIYKADSVYTEAAMALAVLHHPMGEGLRNYPHRGYLVRDGYQIVGKKLDQPSDFVVCWTDDGSEGETTRKTGGTGQALRIAYAVGIPIFNLRNADSMPRLKAFLKEGTDMITVANKKARGFRPMPQDIYIGRPGPFGNPYEIGRDGTRKDVVESFRAATARRIKIDRDQGFIKALINIPDDARLVCWCSPESCHGDILAKVIPWVKKHQSEYLD